MELVFELESDMLVRKRRRMGRGIVRWERNGVGWTGNGDAELMVVVVILHASRLRPKSKRFLDNECAILILTSGTALAIFFFF